MATKQTAAFPGKTAVAPAVGVVETNGGPVVDGVPVVAAKKAPAKKAAAKKAPAKKAAAKPRSAAAKRAEPAPTKAPSQKTIKPTTKAQEAMALKQHEVKSLAQLRGILGMYPANGKFDVSRVGAIPTIEIVNIRGRKVAEIKLLKK